MWKALLALAVVVAVVVVVVAIPIQFYALSVLCAFTDNYEMVFTPTFYVSHGSRMTVSPAVSETAPPMALAGPVDSIYLSINITAVNVNGSMFFNGSLLLNTLADQKITFVKDYDSASFTKNLTLSIDAYLLVDYSNQPDLERSYSGQWELTLP
jgi:hypothetical protein